VIGCNGTVTSFIVVSGEGVQRAGQRANERQQGIRTGKRSLLAGQRQGIGTEAREAINERLGWHRDGTKEHGKA